MARKARKSKQQEEIRRCSGDFKHFCKYLRIVDKKSNVVPFVLLPAQEEFLVTADAHPWLYVLKARQLGMTTVIAAWMFWKALLTPNFKVGVLAHSGESAQAIFEIYSRLYKFLPDFLKFRTEKANVREMRFFHGGMIRVTTANSENFRGTTYQALHCSEFAFWASVDKTIRSAFQCCGPDAHIYLETTANGLNDAHRIWQEENGFHGLFIPWVSDPGYALSKAPKTIIPKIKEYSEERGLTEGQMWWVQQTYQTKCMSNWNSFLQEYPSNADEAFIVSGERFFGVVYPDAQPKTGYTRVYQPQKYKIYTMGVDVASGSPSGDYSAFVVLDVTDKKAPITVSSFYDRVPPHQFAEIVRNELIEYDALAVVEANSYGLAILEFLVSKHFAYIFKRTQYDKMAKRWIERMGFYTSANTRPVLLSRLLEYVTNEWLVPADPSFQHEINTFSYSSTGKPEATSGKHDDMIFAHGLALMGMDQVDLVTEVKMSQKPRNIAEVLQFEMSTGNLYRNQSSDYEKSRWGIDKEASSPLNGVD